ncbi:hypothetical protein [Desulfurobacterium atlanticum]|uniref:Signal recognition particle receptor subunit beta, a GTPase n=1 Tax=Desulfurobacterium atlanticum TaxID=240169 RepID=A0A238XTT1_9BACT|nr:hypothetical protein [Desulfurobacterium atlanticum]SNR61968.1 hypothetical protein SAMN06265340_101243 [Desulfurobacterium atlanticum]
MKRRLKVLVAGAFDSGKTTFVKTSNSEGYDGVEVSNFDVEELKEIEGTTTVGLDISNVKIGDKEFLLVGLPGQKRFSFLWDTLGSDFDAIIILHSAEHPVEETKFYIDFFSKTSAWEKAKKLIVLTKTDLYPDFDKQKLASFGIPVLSCDPRNKEEVQGVLQFLYQIALPR